ncbi:polysaccharide deacetylase family protein [Qipengyuania aurantiaca]|uniref:Chitooligosaccharide deacetylase n=1 Tax=Qipengyuania aurantiaca TaxID=2867233 RepID=A0ABX8ZR72_9SPHN|nr:polysaccharide deacetylase family protein [Qipengyuania aurantiaca]QZD90254.1 polysaccharide deacetylase family protein [Qipengyuania aurantiaca]
MQKRWIIVPIVVLAAVGGLWQISKAKCFQLVGDVVCRVETQRKIVALSFDDGPTPEGVDAILPILAKYDASATFFLIGSRMERFPGSAEKLLAAGHELGNHSYTHQRNLLKPQSFYETEVNRTQALLQTAGSDTRWFRPPFGKRLIGLPLAVERADLLTITWDVEEQPEKFDGNPRAFASDIIARVRPGSIILMHPMYRHNQTARDALPLVLQGLQERGYEVVSVSRLLDAAPD